MYQPQISSANSAAHFTGMLAALDEYRRQKAGAKKQEKQARRSSRLANLFKTLTRRSKESRATGATAETA